MSAAAAALCAGLLGVGICSQAHAQLGGDREFSEGPGIKAGDLEIHPGIAVNAGYDSNVFKADGETGPNSAGQKVVGSGFFGVNPHIHLTTMGKKRKEGGEDADARAEKPVVAFKAGLSATYLHYLIDDAPKNIAADVDTWLGILPERPVNLELMAAYNRTIAPFAPGGTGDDYVTNNYRPGAKLNLQTRSAVLSASASYTPAITRFASSAFNNLNNIAHTVEATTDWKFLPHTGLAYDVSFTYQDYGAETSSDTGGIVISDNRKIRTRIGLNGAITPSFSVRMLVGYAAFDIDNEDLNEHEDIVGDLTLSMKIAEKHKFEGGYTRDLTSSPLGAWIRTDGVRAALGFDFGALNLGINASYAYLTYGPVLVANETGDGVVGAGVDYGSKRRDHKIDAGISSEYVVLEWLALTLDGSVTDVITDFDFRALESGEPVPDPAAYLAFTVVGGVRARY